MTTRPARPQAPLLDVRGLRVSISGDEGRAQVLDNIDLSIAPGRIVGVVGESGCGKSTVIRAVLRVLPRGAEIESGAIRFDGEDLLGLGEGEMARRIPGQGDRVHSPGPLPRPQSRLPGRDPALSRSCGGTRRTATATPHATSARHASGTGSGWSSCFASSRCPIRTVRSSATRTSSVAASASASSFAGALACEPRLVIADEPTTALDVTTQLEILKLLRSLSREYDVSMLFVTHDFGVVAQLCDEVNVIYAGQSVEAGDTVDILEAPRHPYTRALLACHPDHSDDLTGIPGAVPSPLTPPPGCRFHPRCEHARADCRDGRPTRVQLGEGHSVECVLYSETGEEAGIG